MKSAESRIHGRIARQLTRSDLPNAQRAVEEAARLALLKTVPVAARSYRYTRRTALSRARPAEAAAVRLRFKVVIAIAVILAAAGPALIWGSKHDRRFHVLDVQDGGFWTGLLEVIAVIIFWCLARHRHQPGSSLLNVQPRVYLTFGILWSLPLLVVLLYRRNEIDRFAPQAPVLGLVLSAGAIAAVIVLYFRTRAADVGVPLNTEGALLGPEGIARVQQTLDEWWGAAPARLTELQRERVVRAWRAGLETLESHGVIRPGERLSAGATPPWLLWREDRR